MDLTYIKLKQTFVWLTMLTMLNYQLLDVLKLTVIIRISRRSPCSIQSVNSLIHVFFSNFLSLIFNILAILLYSLRTITSGRIDTNRLQTIDLKNIVIFLHCTWFKCVSFLLITEKQLVERKENIALAFLLFSLKFHLHLSNYIRIVNLASSILFNIPPCIIFWCSGLILGEKNREVLPHSCTGLESSNSIIYLIWKKQCFMWLYLWC